MMADNKTHTHKKPKKGILKNSSSFDHQESSTQHRRKSKETKWDEMNIIATLHPADKDYGHMKIDEPKTPYNYDETDAHEQFDADDLAEKLKSDRPAKVLEEDASSSEEEEEELSPEEKALRKEFEMKRKAHYNEYSAVKLARKLLEEDEDDEDEDIVEEEEEVKKEEPKKEEPSGSKDVGTSSRS